MLTIEIICCIIAYLIGGAVSAYLTGRLSNWTDVEDSGTIAAVMCIFWLWPIFIILTVTLQVVLYPFELGVKRRLRLKERNNYRI